LCEKRFHFFPGEQPVFVGICAFDSVGDEFGQFVFRQLTVFVFVHSLEHLRRIGWPRWSTAWTSSLSFRISGPQQNGNCRGGTGQPF
jgi:hypothetical protein